jgi:HAD superfamily hydrolase (TIGR01509 family)
MSNTSRAPTRAIAFDWGGVFTVGTFDGRSTQRLADKYGLDVVEVRKHYFELVHKLELGTWTLVEFWSEFGSRIGLGNVPYADFESLYVGSILENDPMYAFLPTISSEFRVGLLSNNYPTICDILERDQRWKRFDRMVFSNKIGVKKPDPASFEALLASLELPGDRVVFVDDVKENLEAAAKLGIAGILYDAHEHARFLSDLEAWKQKTA